VKERKIAEERQNLPPSRREIAPLDSPDAIAKSACDHLNTARAALICRVVTIFFPYRISHHNDPNSAVRLKLSSNICSIAGAFDTRARRRAGLLSGATLEGPAHFDNQMQLAASKFPLRSRRDSTCQAEGRAPTSAIKLSKLDCQRSHTVMPRPPWVLCPVLRGFVHRWIMFSQTLYSGLLLRSTALNSRLSQLSGKRLTVAEAQGRDGRRGGHGELSRFPSCGPARSASARYGPFLMLWTAPPPARRCHGPGRRGGDVIRRS